MPFIPLLFYILGVYPGFISYINESEYFEIILSLNTVAIGLLFFFGFIILSKEIKVNVIQNYLIISGYGFLMFNVATLSFADHTPFPPYGIITISHVGLSSFMIYFGLLNLSRLISRDFHMRKTLQRILKNNQKFIVSLGVAEFDIEKEKIISRLVKENIDILNRNDQEFASEEIINEEIKKYVYELRKFKKGSMNNNE